METDIGLKHIRVLTCLYKEKSLKRTARILGKTPSAISKTLARLRETYNDPLFVASASGGEVTPRLLEIIEDLQLVQGILEKSLGENSPFDPALFTGEISLTCSMGLIERFGAALFSELSRLAPRAQILLYTWTGETQEQLASAQITAAIHILSEEKPQHIYQKRMLDDEMVLALKADHPAADMKQALAYPAIILKTSGWNDQRYRFLENLRAKGMNFVHGGLVDHLSLGLKLIKNSEMVMFVPKVVITPDLKYFSFDKACQVPLKLVYCIKTSNRNSLLHKWLYDVCVSVIKHP
ncbi:LysR family transcriptional regulator [Psychromonas aquimarina]|uniref:LysR family transcriptional regulator n=1 Tax=Psychromonas aquimarina TaxID=444919 RepID=UPI0003F9285B|nr:LysR family transcriptional regulator [Psychromonas aquimarina]